MDNISRETSVPAQKSTGFSPTQKNELIRGQKELPPTSSLEMTQKMSSTSSGYPIFNLSSVQMNQDEEYIKQNEQSILYSPSLESIKDLLDAPALQFYQRSFYSLGYTDLTSILTTLHETQWNQMIDEIAQHSLQHMGVEMLPAHRQLILSRLKIEKTRREILLRQHYHQLKNSVSLQQLWC